MDEQWRGQSNTLLELSFREWVFDPAALQTLLPNYLCQQQHQLSLAKHVLHLLTFLDAPQLWRPRKLWLWQRRPREIVEMIHEYKIDVEILGQLQL